MSRVKKKRIRKSTRIAYILILVIVLVFFISQCILLLEKDETSYKKKEVYNYTNKFAYDYTVNLVKNRYIDEPSLGMEQQVYITDLIDNLSLNLNYSYIASTDSNINYKYNITGKLIAVYTRDGDEQKILEKNYNLLEEQNKTSNGKEIDIAENLELNLQEQNKLIKDFEQNMNMSVDATYTVILNIETDTKVEGENVNNKISPKIVIDIGKKTTKISGENNQEDTKYISTKIAENETSNTSYFVIYGIIIAIALIALRYLLRKTESTVIIRNEYRQEINRIIRLCQDKIVQVKSQPDIDKDKLIEVKDFGELVKLSEELFKPILFWEDRDKSESWFIVMSNNTIYRHIIKKD